MKPDLKAVLFDLDDTLHDDTFAFTSAAQEVASEIAGELGIDAAALKDAYVEQAEGFWHNLRSEHVRVPLSRVREDLWAAALASVGLSRAALARRCARSYYEYRKKYFELYPGALDLLQSLHRRGLRLGMITNGVSETHREKIALLQIAKYFDAVFLADEVGMVKPDPALFAHACKELGCAPSSSAMVGDRYERDIAGAIASGLYTIWVNVRDEPLPAGALPPDATVRAISEAGEYL